MADQYADMWIIFSHIMRAIVTLQTNIWMYHHLWQMCDLLQLCLIQLVLPPHPPLHLLHHDVLKGNVDLRNALLLMCGEGSDMTLYF